MFGESHDIHYDWPAFADNERKGYLPAMDRVRRGELAWTRIDDLHRMILDDLLREARITSVSDENIDHSTGHGTDSTRGRTASPA